MSETPFDQQTDGRYTVVPRTLIFLERDDALLLLRGAGHKWFAGLYNGIGGHVEAGEDVLAAAMRETREETGLSPASLTLAGIVHVIGERPGVMMFVFHGAAGAGDIHTTDEGTLEWVPIDDIDEYPLVPDLTWLIPHVLHRPTAPPFTATFHFGADRLTIEPAAGKPAIIPL